MGVIVGAVVAVGTGVNVWLGIAVAEGMLAKAVIAAAVKIASAETLSSIAVGDALVSCLQAVSNRVNITKKRIGFFKIVSKISQG